VPVALLSYACGCPIPITSALRACPPGYEYRVFVTSRTEDVGWLWKHYDQRAAIEPRFSELKEDLAADNFCLKQFYSSEAAFLSVLFLFNLLSLLQSLTNPAPAPQQRPATLRLKLFTCGAIAGKSGRKLVLFMSAAWGGLKSRKLLLDAILQAQFPTSPKLNPTAAAAPPQDPISGLFSRIPRRYFGIEVLRDTIFRGAPLVCHVLRETFSAETA
jgi:hypothetical protein